MTEGQSPYTVAALSKKPSGVSGEEFAGLGLRSSMSNCSREEDEKLVVRTRRLKTVRRSIGGDLKHDG